LLRAARATPDGWWAQALKESHQIESVVRECGATGGPARVFRVCPSRSSQLVGEGWIAIGDAAIALDPLGGQGVVLALESACRAAEAAEVDPSFVLLGKDYRDGLLSRFNAHLNARVGVYRDAAATLSPAFMHAAVTAGVADGAEIAGAG
jgi:flavin-dependent dehydrogenase